MKSSESLTYAIWNQKGGVGKSFVTFITAVEMARERPDYDIYVIDMCPQSNITQTILGGNSIGVQNWENLIQAKKTVGAYFENRLIKAKIQGATGLESTYIQKVFEINKKMTPNLNKRTQPFELYSDSPNLFIVSGDQKVEDVSSIMQDLSRNFWKDIHSWLKDLIDAIKMSNNRNKVILIDCNPSFSIYTKLAILAADYLIIPCTPDLSSLMSISSVLRNVYGVDDGKNYAVPYTSFYDEATKNNNFSLPKIHTVISNRTTLHVNNENREASGFKSAYDGIREKFKTAYQNNREFFVAKNAEDIFVTLDDMHTAGLVATYHGIPPRHLKPAGSGYTVTGQSKSTKLNKQYIEKIRQQAQNLIGRL